MALLLGDGKAEFPDEVEWKIDRDCCNDVWQKKFDIGKSLLAGSIERGQRTILLDEPELGFGLMWQARLWQLLGGVTGFQLIVATHCPFALACGANIIETQPGYDLECKQLLVELGTLLK